MIKNHQATPDLEERDRDSHEWTLRNNGYEEIADLLALLRSQARDVIQHARLAEFHFSQWDDAQYPGEKAHSLKYLRGEMEALRAALARVSP